MGDGFDVDGLIADLAATVRDCAARSDAKSGAMACVELGRVYANFLLNPIAARAWYQRADRLIADEPPCVEQGWVAVASIGCEVDDPADLLARAELALDRARQFGDVNLETKALADAGLAEVQAGLIPEGFRRLDEAMALACAGADDSIATAQSVCSFFTACYYTGDFERVGSWEPELRGRGVIGTHGSGPLFLSAHCQSVHAASLRELGRWDEAEALLLAAIGEFETGIGGDAWHPVIELAELRICQGRLGEAETLLLGRDSSMQALVPAARMHFARGDHELAEAVARRGLQAMGDDRVRVVALSEVVVAVALAAGRVDDARQAAEDVVARTSGLPAATLVARAEAALAQVRLVDGDLPGAAALLREAVDRVLDAPAPLLRAGLRLRLSGVLRERGDVAGARLEARAAAGDLHGLDAARLDLAQGVVFDDEQRALLTLADGDDVASAPLAERPATGSRVATLARDGKWWTVAFDATSVRVPDGKGLRYLGELVSAPGVERHVLDLVDRVEGVAAAGEGPDRRALGDAGALLDSTARDEYRRRIEALRAEADDALEMGDDARALTTQDELDALTAELARAFGLGGRGRKASSAAEKARLNVTRALRSAAAKLDEALPEAAGWLDRRLRTGAFCRYEPLDGDDVRWVVQA